MVINFVGGGSAEGMVLSVGLLLLGFLCGFAACGSLVVAHVLSSYAGRKDGGR